MRDRQCEAVGVVAPEQRPTDLQRRHAEHTGLQRRIGIGTQHAFDRIAGKGVRVNLQPIHQWCERLRAVARPALRPDPLEHPIHHRLGAASGDTQP